MPQPLSQNQLVGLKRSDLAGILAVFSLTVAVAAAGAAAGDWKSKWYSDLRKPAWQPAGSTIGAIWSVLYLCIATAGSLLWLRRRQSDSGLAALFVSQSLLNAAWTPLFTRARRPGLAAFDCAALTAVNCGLVASAWRVRRAAALLLVPYAAWTAFATFLNGTIYGLNRQPC